MCRMHRMQLRPCDLALVPSLLLYLLTFAVNTHRPFKFRLQCRKSVVENEGRLIALKVEIALGMWRRGCRVTVFRDVTLQCGAA